MLTLSINLRNGSKDMTDAVYPVWKGAHPTQLDKFVELTNLINFTSEIYSSQNNS